MTNISVLGSTGSIGTQTLDVLNEHKNLLFPQAFSAGTNIDLLTTQIKKFHPKIISVKNDKDAINLKRNLGRKSPEIFWGENGNIEVATHSKSDRVVIATPGLPGIRPTLEAIKRGKTIALATKEVLVAAGEIITNEAEKYGVKILPIDSEHSAIFQCLEGRSISEVSRVFITCSGGPFRGKKLNNLKKVSVKQALNHPSWKMGKKISIDSATLMNKGFEVIEASWLFNIPIEKIKVVVHPQSVIHSAVEFIDGTIIAQIGPADMRLPIQFALLYPKKRTVNKFRRFTFLDFPNISFESPDKKTFRCLNLAYHTAKKGGTYPSVLNAANDIAVERFLVGLLPFYKISDVIEKTLSAHKKISKPKLEDIIGADRWAREYASKLFTF